MQRDCATDVVDEDKVKAPICLRFAFKLRFAFFNHKTGPVYSYFYRIRIDKDDDL